MPLQNGLRLGTYEIIGKLGEGGPPPFALMSSHARTTARLAEAKQTRMR